MQPRWDPYEDYQDDLSECDDRHKIVIVEEEKFHPLKGGGDGKHETRPLIKEKPKTTKPTKVKRPNLRQLFATKSTPQWWMLWLISFVTASVVEVIFVTSYYYERDFRVLWLVAVAGVLPFCLLVLFCLFGFRQTRVLPIALVMLGAITIGEGGGLWGGYFYGKYWSYSTGNVYSNVNPNEDSSGYSKPHYFEFINNTYIKSPLVGSTDAPNGVRYCVAPILVMKSPPPSEVKYWAVDYNCCQGSDRRASATCSNWGLRNHVLGKVLDTLKRSYAEEAALAAQEWHNFKGSLQAQYVEVYSTIPTDEKESYLRAAWARLAIAPIISPLGLILWGLIYSMLIFCFPTFLTTTIKSGTGKKKAAARRKSKDKGETKSINNNGSVAFEEGEEVM